MCEVKASLGYEKKTLPVSKKTLTTLNSDLSYAIDLFRIVHLKIKNTTDFYTKYFHQKSINTKNNIQTHTNKLPNKHLSITSAISKQNLTNKQAKTPNIFYTSPSSLRRTLTER